MKTGMMELSNEAHPPLLFAKRGKNKRSVKSRDKTAGLLLFQFLTIMFFFSNKLKD